MENELPDYRDWIFVPNGLPDDDVPGDVPDDEQQVLVPGDTRSPSPGISTIRFLLTNTS